MRGLWTILACAALVASAGCNQPLFGQPKPWFAKGKKDVDAAFFKQIEKDSFPTAQQVGVAAHSGAPKKLSAGAAK